MENYCLIEITKITNILLRSRKKISNEARSRRSFYFEVAYEDDPNHSKRRPVLILHEDDENVLLLVATTTKERNNPLKPHDHYKIPILNWRKTGLREASWCKGKRLIQIPRTDFENLVKVSDYIGRMHPVDFNYIIEKIEQLHNEKK